MTKAVSNENLALFKQKCDETYAKVGESRTGGGITQSTVIERSEELPTATADSPDFVQTPDGTLYRKKAVESTGGLVGTWAFNNNLNISSNFQYNINFTVVQSGNQFTFMRGVNSPKGESLFYGDDLIAYDGGAWVSQNYKTIQITDISLLTDEAAFTSWLTANATKQGGGGGTVTYSYVALADA